MTNRTVPQEEASANYVPAAAVRRRRRALSGITGRKARVGGCLRGDESPLLNGGSVPRNGGALWSVEGECGMAGGAVKCVEIGQNTSGEGGTLGHN